MELKDIPVIEGDTPDIRLVSFFKNLGWDPSGKYHIDPTKIKLHHDDFTKMLENEMQIFPDNRVSIGMMWMNWGPSGSGETEGKVELHDGWLVIPEGKAISDESI